MIMNCIFYEPSEKLYFFINDSEFLLKMRLVLVVMMTVIPPVLVQLVVHQCVHICLDIFKIKYSFLIMTFCVNKDMSTY